MATFNPKSRRAAIPAMRSERKPRAVVTVVNRHGVDISMNMRRTACCLVPAPRRWRWKHCSMWMASATPMIITIVETMLLTIVMGCPR
jgi:hypothetical protein